MIKRKFSLTGSGNTTTFEELRDLVESVQDAVGLIEEAVHPSVVIEQDESGFGFTIEVAW
jgi:hypothetical protein